MRRVSKPLTFLCHRQKRRINDVKKFFSVIYDKNRQKVENSHSLQISEPFRKLYDSEDLSG